ncbi:hypothetical protein PIB30_011336 [Stylosanthes scabra]|uniref:Uncharacterized protein n=1 Tax=Stylosanthes scabra TaxID=79078 RepID=A0ABU6W7M0_9FABA|nr:hypothetical protein [Stylosanthes scabra]
MNRPGTSGWTGPVPDRLLLSVLSSTNQRHSPSPFTGRRSFTASTPRPRPLKHDFFLAFGSLTLSRLCLRRANADAGQPLRLVLAFAAPTPSPPQEVCNLASFHLVQPPSFSLCHSLGSFNKEL